MGSACIFLLTGLFAISSAHGLNKRRRSEVAKPTPTLLVDENGQNLPDDPNSPKVGWQTLESGGENSKWKAVGQLFRGNKGGCTATVVKPPNCTDPKKQKVQVLTNGHCTGHNLKQKFSVKFGMFSDTPDSERSEIGAKAIYSGQNKKDLGVLELDVDYETLSRFGIQPIDIGTTLNMTEKFENIAIPVQGISKKDQVLRKNPECQPEKKTTLIDMFRYFPEEIAMSHCSAVGGSSGSGLFNSNGELVGLMNAGTLDQDPQPPKHNCETDSCVYDGKNPPFREKTNFAFDVTFLNKCYQDCRLNTKLPDCILPDQDSLIRTAPSPNNENWTPDLQRKITFESDKYIDLQVKGCDNANTCSCSEESGYQKLPKSESFTLSPATYFPGRASYKAVKGQDPIFQFLCLRGQNKDGSWDSLKNTTAYPLYLYNKPSGPKLERPQLKSSK